MAALICPRGDADPGDGTVCVHCGSYLRKAPAAGSPAADGGPPRAARSTAPVMEICAEQGCTLELHEHECPLGHPQAARDTTVPHARTGAGPEPGPRDRARTGGPVLPLAVVFPWGSHPVSTAPLVIGRSVTDAGDLAERMLEHGKWTGRDYGNVSRTHAIVWADAGGTWIRHVSGTNSTHLNGTPLPPDEPRRLGPGDVLRFAAGLRAHVEQAEQGEGAGDARA